MTSVADDDDVIRVLVARLARPHRSGGLAIERAALLAAGADFGAAMTWIEAQGGRGEAPPGREERGLYGSRQAVAEPMPLRYILPAGALSRAADGATQGRETP
jgi:hypothetical protein